MRVQGNQKTAHNFYGQVLANDPQNLRAHMGVGKMLRSNKKHKEAIQEFRLAAGYHPDNKELKTEIIKTYIEMNEGKIAERETILLLKTTTQTPQDYNLLAVAQDLQGRHLEAQKNYQQSLTLDQNQLPVLSNQGLSLSLLGQYQRALPILERVYQHPDATDKDRHNLAVTYALSGNANRARELFRVDLDESATEENLHYLAGVKTKQEPLRRPSLTKVSFEKSAASSVREVTPLLAPKKAPPKKWTPQKANPSALKGTYVQVGAFSSQKNASATHHKLQKINGVKSTLDTITTKKGTQQHRVFMGPFKDKHQVLAGLKTLQSNGFTDGFIKSF